LNLDRCKALTDGVMAFAITLLVVGIDVPGRTSPPELIAFLMGLGHTVAVYTASFWLLGTYWFLHGTILAFFGRANRALIWLNLLFLLPVTFIPFVSKLKDVYRLSRLAVLLLGGVNILIGACLVAVPARAAPPSPRRRGQVGHLTADHDQPDHPRLGGHRRLVHPPVRQHTPPPDHPLVSPLASSDRRGSAQCRSGQRLMGSTGRIRAGVPC
jgi:hypothetical protein